MQERYIDRHLAARIVRGFDEAGFTADCAAERLDIRREDYLAIEQGKRRIDAFLIAKVSSLIGKPVRWFYEGLPGQHIFKDPPSSSR